MTDYNFKAALDLARKLPTRKVFDYGPSLVGDAEFLAEALLYLHMIHEDLVKRYGEAVRWRKIDDEESGF